MDVSLIENVQLGGRGCHVDGQWMLGHCKCVRKGWCCLCWDVGVTAEISLYRDYLYQNLYRIVILQVELDI